MLCSVNKKYQYIVFYCRPHVTSTGTDKLRPGLQISLLENAHGKTLVLVSIKWFVGGVFSILNWKAMSLCFKTSGRLKV
jgi:hypothetical protein